MTDVYLNAFHHLPCFHISPMLKLRDWQSLPQVGLAQRTILRIRRVGT